LPIVGIPKVGQTKSLFKDESGSLVVTAVTLTVTSSGVFQYAVSANNLNYDVVSSGVLQTLSVSGSDVKVRFVGYGEITGYSLEVDAMVSSIITNDGKRIHLDRVYNSVPSRSSPIKFKIGMGVTAPSLTDVDLVNPVPIQGYEIIDSCEVSDWSDGSDMTTSLNGTHYKVGSYSLNLTKDGTGGTAVYTEKNTPSLDFTSKELNVWVYIIDASMLAKLASSGCLEVWFGSDSSNYYKWVKNRSDLVVGWNRLNNLTSANATVVGSPVIAACDYTRIKVTSDIAATIWGAGDLSMDDIKLTESTDYFKTFEAGYPSLDYSALTATIRCRVTATMANGYDLKEFGLVNADGTPLLYSRDLTGTISKSETDEIIIEPKFTEG